MNEDTYDGMNPSDNPQGDTATPFSSDPVLHDMLRGRHQPTSDQLPARPRDPSEDYDLRGEIVELVTERAVYAVLTVWPLNDESDVFSWGDGSKAANAKRVAEFNATNTSGKSYLIRVPLPPAK